MAVSTRGRAELAYLYVCLCERESMCIRVCGEDGDGCGVLRGAVEGVARGERVKW